MSSSVLPKERSNGSSRPGSFQSRVRQQQGDILLSMAKAIDGLRAEVSILTDDQAIVNGKLDEVLALLRDKHVRA